MIEINTIYNEDCLTCLRKLPDESIDCCVTSPPYYALRDYGVPGQIGLEQTPEEYVDKLVAIFREVRRVLRSDGTLWVNIGDSYMSCGGASRHLGNIDPKNKKSRGGFIEPTAFKHPTIKPKDLIGIPWMLAFALRADGWYLRQDIIWAKPNAMPESVVDRCTRSHEYIFLFSKKRNYYYDYKAIAEKAVTYQPGKRVQVRPLSKRQKMAPQYNMGENAHQSLRAIDNMLQYRNKRSVWSVNTRPNKSSHIAAYPEELIAPCILAGCRVGGIVLDPFVGSGTTAAVARKLNRNYIGIDLNTEYCYYAQQRALVEENLFNNIG